MDHTWEYVNLAAGDNPQGSPRTPVRSNIPPMRPRSTGRRDAVSDRQAVAQLLHEVGLSARKRSPAPLATGTRLHDIAIKLADHTADTEVRHALQIP